MNRRIQSRCDGIPATWYGHCPSAKRLFPLLQEKYFAAFRSPATILHESFCKFQACCAVNFLGQYNIHRKRSTKQVSTGGPCFNFHFRVSAGRSIILARWEYGIMFIHWNSRSDPKPPACPALNSLAASLHVDCAPEPWSCSCRHGALGLSWTAYQYREPLLNTLAVL